MEAGHLEAGRLLEMDPGLRWRLDSCLRLRLVRCLRSRLDSFKVGGWTGV